MPSAINARSGRRPLPPQRNRCAAVMPSMTGMRMHGTSAADAVDALRRSDTAGDQRAAAMPSAVNARSGRGSLPPQRNRCAAVMPSMTGMRMHGTSAADAVDALRRSDTAGDQRAAAMPSAVNAQSGRRPLPCRQSHSPAASLALLRSSRSSATKASAAPTQMNASAGLNTAKRTKMGSMKSMTEP